MTTTPVTAEQIGQPGTPKREMWVAGCAQRDLAAAADHSDEMPEWVRGTMRDGAEALNRLLAMLKAQEPAVVGDPLIGALAAQRLRQSDNPREELAALTTHTVSEDEVELACAAHAKAFNDSGGDTRIAMIAAINSFGVDR